MPERLLVLTVLTVAVVLAVLAVRRWNAHRVQRLLAAPAEPLWDSLGEAPDGRSTLVSFSSPSCMACRAAQAPAVEAVGEQLGASELRVIRVDASRRPEVAQAFGVLTVPSTVVLAPTGQVVAVNHGFAPSAKLVEQLQRAVAL